MCLGGYRPLSEHLVKSNEKKKGFGIYFSNDWENGGRRIVTDTYIINTKRERQNEEYIGIQLI